uniref:Putative secreted protein n=1 Tax=Panstrongylus lignarius TaxID=156445 RepID=A0A224Y381_9HEMI
MTLSVSSTFLLISAASCLRVSNVVITESSSRILPLASFNACSNDFSSCRNRRWNSPCNFSKSDLFSSISGRSAFNILIKTL